MSAITELPNRLFRDGRSVLARFGYRHLEDGEIREDWAEMWEHLRGDFLSAGRKQVTTYDDLTSDCQGLARAYMSVRLLADRNLEICEGLHVRLFSGGINTDDVERYAEARDAYEDTVEAFGAAREALDGALPHSG